MKPGHSKQSSKSVVEKADHRRGICAACQQQEEDHKHQPTESWRLQSGVSTTVVSSQYERGNLKISMTIVLSVSRRLLQPAGDAAKQSGLPHNKSSHQALFSERQGTTGMETS